MHCHKGAKNTKRRKLKLVQPYYCYSLHLLFVSLRLCGEMALKNSILVGVYVLYEILILFVDHLAFYFCGWCKFPAFDGPLFRH